MVWNDPILRIVANNDQQKTFLSLPEGEFMSFIVMTSWWYQALQLVSRQV
jgi:hypothetical protein